MGEEPLMTQVLHIKESGGWNIGPEIRKCTNCGTRLWLASDGIWTDDRKTWVNPPEGYISCGEEAENG
jgi:hypothetical protein